MTFLIAEDDRLWRDFLVELVTAAGEEHLEVDNWPKAITLVREGGLSGIVADLSLGTDTEAGIEALGVLSSITSPPHTMVICTHYSNRVIENCYKLPFVQLVVPKAKLSEHADEIVAFFGAENAAGKLSKLLVMGASRQQFPVSRSALRQPKEKVFVVSGRNLAARREMFAFLRALGLDPVEWGQAIRATKEGAPYTGDVVDLSLREAGAVVVLLTGDDEGRLREPLWKDGDSSDERDYAPRPRQNVVFEAGIAMALLPRQTIFVQLGNFRLFSDIEGRHLVRFRGTVADRNELAQRLETALDRQLRGGTDWLSAGSFEGVSL